jgi:hypothetical protein
MALSLYAYNVSPYERAQRLYNHFEGACAELVDLVEILDKQRGYEATALAFPTASVYVQHALAQYGEEACQRIAAETIFRTQKKR